MRFFTSTLVTAFIFVSSIISAQPNGPWVKSKNTPDKTFAEYQQEFNLFWKNKTPEKGQGFKQFKRWEHFWQSRLLKDGTLPSSAFIWSGVSDAIPKGAGTDATKDQSLWLPMGPTDYELTGSWSAGHGRINVVTVDPNDPNTIYIGAPAGGIWKSTDGGQNWVILNDQLGVIGVSDIAIDPNDSEIIYIATGDDDAGDTYSVGVMKTTDGGLNWNTTGLTLTGNSRVSKVVLDPDNSQIVYAATNSGLYKSSNGGTSFSVVFAQSTRDFAFKPGDSQTIYTVTSSSFYRSTNGGSTFTQISSGLPGSDVSRIVIGVTPANSAFVYLSIAANDNGFKGLYRSTNSGSSFSLRNNTTDIYEANQAWYDLAIAVDPSNANIVYNGVLNIWKSTNGGTGFTKMNSWSNPTGASYTHADIHYLGFYGNILFCGSDGGIYKSTNGAANFTDLSPGLQIGQFYAIDGTEQNADAIVGGLQDNGGYYTQSGQGGWKNYYGADGMGCAIDFTNPDVVYGAIQYASNIYKSTDGGNNISNIGSPEDGAWVTPLQLDPNDNTRLLVGYSKLYEYTGTWNALTTFDFSGTLNQFEVAPSNSDVIYFAKGSNLYKTTNGGTTVTQLSGLSSEWITDIAVHNTDQNTLWVTFGGWTNGTKVYKSTNGGASWSNISGALPNIPVNCVVYQHGSNGGIYVGNDIGVYYYDETVGVWDDFFKDLPHTIVNDLVINHTGSVITAGTYGRGVWQSNLSNSSLLAINPFLVEIIDVPAMVCNSSISPGVRVKNLGTEELTSFTLEYGLSNYNLSYNWTGNLSSLSDTIIYLNQVSLTEGALVFQVRIVNPNGGPDDDDSNNQKEVNFTSVLNGEPLTVHLETDCWGEETTWEIRDVDNNLIVAEGPFNDLSQFDFLLCLNVGCYQFIINDTFGDGLDGQSSNCVVNGDYWLVDGQGNFLVQMTVADFDFQAVHDFCVEGNGLEVDFSSNSTEVCLGSSIDFTDLSLGNPVSWDWEFEGGNPGTSDVQNPSAISYASTGSFDVTLTITNSDGAEVSEIFTDYLTVSEPPVYIVEVIDVFCFGSNDGMITILVTQGIAPFSYSIDGGATFQSNNVFDGLIEGDYSVVVKDASNCISSLDVSVIQPPVIIVEVIQTVQVSCFAGTDGGVIIDATGGIPPLTYRLNGGPFQPNPVFNGLIAGVYSIAVKDGNGCLVSEVFVITEPEEIAADIQTFDLLCFEDESGGSYTITPSGGTGNLTIDGLDPQDDNVPAGIYSFSVVDENGCTMDFEFQIFEPDELLATTLVINDACFNSSNGEVEIIGQGGTPPFYYSVDGGEVVSENIFSDLSPGVHVYSLLDANACESAGTFAILESDEITGLVSQTQEVLCFGENNATISIEASGGTPPYLYYLNGDGPVSNPEFENLGAGSYNITIEDVNDCFTIETIEILEPTELQIEMVTVEGVNCNGENNGIIELLANGGVAPYTYAIDGGIATPSGLFENLSAGWHTFIIADFNDCSLEFAFLIIEPEQLVIDEVIVDETDGNDGSIDLEVTGGTPPYTYLWSNGAESQDISDLNAGDYTVVVTDANACTIEESFTVLSTVGVEELLLLNNVKVFPNPANNQVFINLENSYDEMLVEFLTDDGKIVRSKIISEEREIKFNVTDLSAGTYFIKLNYKESIKTIKILLVR